MKVEIEAPGRDKKEYSVSEMEIGKLYFYFEDREEKAAYLKVSENRVIYLYKGSAMESHVTSYDRFVLAPEGTRVILIQ